MSIAFRTAFGSHNTGATQPLVVNLPGHSNIALRGTPALSNNGGGGTSITCTFPSGIVVGDQLVMAVTVVGGTGTTITTPGGWSLLDRQNSGTALAQALYWIVATSTEVSAGSVAVTITSNKASGAVAAIRNADPTQPVSAQFSGKVNASSLTIDFNALGTWSSANGIDFAFGGMARGANTAAVPATYTNWGSSSSTGGGAGSRTQSNLGSRALTGVTTVGTLTETWSGTGAVNIGHHIFIKEITNVPVVDGDVMLMAVTARGGTGISILPPNVTIGTGSHPVVFAITPNGAYVYVGNSGSGTVSVIRTSDNTVVATPSVGGSPQAMVMSNDGAHLYVSDGISNVKVIQTSDNTVSATVGVGGAPQYLRITPDDAYVYVPNNTGGTVSVIRTSDNTVISTISGVGTSLQYCAITPDGAYVYVPSRVTTSSFVRVLRVSDNSIFATVTGTGSIPQNLVIRPDGAYVYVGNQGSSTVSVIRTSDNTVVSTVTVGSSPANLVISSDGAYVYVSNNSGSTVSVIRTSDNTVVSTITVGSNPGALSITPDGAYLYCVVSSTYSVSVIRLSDNTIVATPDAGSALFGILATADYVYVGNTTRSNITLIRRSDNTSLVWRLLGPTINSTTDLAQRVFWRVANSEPNSYDVEFSTGARASAVVVSFSDGDVVEPVSDQYAGQANASSTTVTAPALGTWSSVDGIDVGLFGTAFGTTFTPPTNYTEPTDGEAASTPADNTATTTEGAYRALSAVTTVGSIAATAGSAAVNIGHHVFLKDIVHAGYPPTATGAGAAYNASVAVSLNAQSPSGNGASLDATVSTPSTTNAPAESASGTGTASGTSTAVQGSTEIADGDGAALDATVSIGGAETDADAETGSGTGAASDTSAALAVSAGLASGTGAANQAAGVPGIQATAENAAGTGAAYPSARLDIATLAFVARGVGEVPFTLANISDISIPPGTYVPPAGTPGFASLVRIEYDEVDITDDVQILTASFTAKANGQVGDAFIRIRDTGSAYTPITGRRLTLWVNGDLKWSGFGVMIQRAYAFPAQNTSTTVTHYWEIQGVDDNILFDKRIVYDAAHPTTHVDFQYLPGTYDDTIINDLFDHYLDLADDYITREGVTRVSPAILDIPGIIYSRGSSSTLADYEGTVRTGTVASAGFTWAQSMDVVQRATGGVYYIDGVSQPNRRILRYVDAETVTSDYALTDTPDTPVDGLLTGVENGPRGYREFTIVENGSALVNEMHIWGGALGAKSMVHSVVEDITSIDDHNRWEDGLLTYGIYRQLTADTVASSYVNGTPANHRGHKDDQVTFSCRTFMPVFKIGDVVEIRNSVFDFSDAMPIREMKTTFVSPWTPVFDLVLGHEINQPWSFYEELRKKLRPYEISRPNWGMPTFALEELGECVCGITDTFTRTVDPGWGTSDSGYSWTTQGGSLSVDGDHGLLSNTVGSAANLTNLSISDLDYLFEFTTPTWSSASTVRFYMYPTPGGGSNQLSQIAFVLKAFPGAPYDGQPYLWIVRTDAGEIDAAFGFTQGTHYCVRVHCDLTYTAVRIWLYGTTEPGTWTLTLTGYPFTPGSDFGSVIFGNGGAVDANTTATIIDNLDIVGVNRCTYYKFDNFIRTVSHAWGTSTFGLPWTGFQIDATHDAGVNGLSGYLISVNTQGGHVDSTSGPWSSGVFTMTSRFRFTRNTNVGLLFEFNPPTGTDIYERLFFNRSNSYDTQLEFQVSSGNDNTVVVDTLTTGWWLIKWSQTLALSQAKAWAEGTTEPDWQVTANPTSGTFDPADIGRLHVQIDNELDNTSYTAFFDYIDFDYDGKPCYLVDGTPVFPPPLGPDGPTLGPSSGELAIDSGDHLTYQLSSRYVAGSTSVWVNGVAQVYGAADDYLESPSSGTITFNTALDPGDDVVVDYEGIGPA